MLRKCVADFHHADDIRDFHRMHNSGILGYIHKASEGLTFTDPAYAARRARALTVNGLLVGSYHFARKGDGAVQAHYYLSKATPGPNELLCLDWEDAAVPQACAEHFVSHVFEATGKWPVLYSGQSFLGDHFNNSPASPLANCALWVARYGPDEPVVPMPWSSWDMWQYSESATVPGVSNKCDCSHWNGAEADLRGWWIS